MNLRLLCALSLVAAGAMAQELTVYRFDAQVKGVDYCPAVEVRGDSLVNSKMGILGGVTSDITLIRNRDLGLIPREQRKAPGAFEVHGENGKVYNLEELRGQVVVIGMFSVDCQASCVQLVELGDFQPKEKQFDMRLFPVSLQGWETVGKFVRKNRKHLPEALQVFLPGTGAKGVGAFGLDIAGLPLVIILDRDGKIATSWIGFEQGRLLARLKALIPEKPLAVQAVPHS